MRNVAASPYRLLNVGNAILEDARSREIITIANSIAFLDLQYDGDGFDPKD